MSMIYSHPLLPSILLPFWGGHFLPFTSFVFSPCLLALNVFVCRTVVPWCPWFYPRVVPPNTISIFQDFWQSLNDNIISVNSITIQFPIGVFLKTIAEKGIPKMIRNVFHEVSIQSLSPSLSFFEVCLFLVPPNTTPNSPWLPKFTETLSYNLWDSLQADVSSHLVPLLLFCLWESFFFTKCPFYNFIFFLPKFTETLLYVLLDSISSYPVSLLCTVIITIQLFCDKRT